jgi:elongation factor P
MITTSDFKRGQWIEIDGEPWRILDVNRQYPTARGASLIVKVKMRNPKTGNVQDKSFRGGDKVNEPNVEERGVQYLYKDAEGYHFMDQESYDQFSLGKDELGDALDYLVDDLELSAMLLDEQVIGVQLPAQVDLKVTECPPAAKGGSGTKKATLETGLVIQVPNYLEQGEVVRVDTSDGRFLQRAKS